MLLVEMRCVSLGRRGQETVVDGGDVLQPLALCLPFDEAVPEAVRAKLESASPQRPLELRPDEVLVVGPGAAHVGQVVDPEVDGEGNRLEASLEHLYNVKFSAGKQE